MLDDIGLGSAIANMIYIVILLITIGGAAVLFNKKLFVAMALWMSVLLNLLAFLFFMGRYRFYPKYLYPIVNRIWPILSAFLVIYLILTYIKKRNAKTK